MTLADVLMITYDRADYVRISLPALLESCGERAKVWLWHNGDDEETLETIRPFLDDGRIARFFHSRENQRILAPTNWLQTHSGADFLSKVDDDCLLPIDWLARLAAAHADVPEFGVIGSWRFRPEDYRPDLASKKLMNYSGGHRLLRNHWVQGSGYLMKRECVKECGPIKTGDSFTGYCVRLARSGWINGWYYPFIQEEHMDDPRSPYTCLHTDEDLRTRLPLTAQRLNVRTLADWEAAVRESAYAVQAAPLDLRHYSEWRRRMRGVHARLGSRGRRGMSQ